MENKITRFDILARDNFTCQYCGRKAPDVELQVDHIYPVSRGGYDDEKNCVTACITCNSSKTNKIYRQLFTNEQWQEVNKNKKPFPYGEYTCYIARFFKENTGTNPPYKLVDKFVKKTVHDAYEFGIIKNRLKQEDLKYMRGLIIAIAKGKTEEEYKVELHEKIKEQEKNRLENKNPFSGMPNWKI